MTSCWRCPVARFLPLLLLIAAGHASAQTAAPRPPNPPPPDYKIAFWYRRTDPLNSMRHRVYDVRKGQYTPAVDDWLKTMKEKYPGYVAYVRDVRLLPETYGSEKKQLAAITLAEYRDKAGPSGGYGLRDAYGLYGGVSIADLISTGRTTPAPDTRSPTGVSEYRRGYGFVESPGANHPPAYLQSGPSGPTSPPTPFPFPYVRPHP